VPTEGCPASSSLRGSNITVDATDIRDLALDIFVRATTRDPTAAVL
jgi:hypothetical protein